MLTSDPTSDSSDTGGSGKSNEGPNSMNNGWDANSVNNSFENATQQFPTPIIIEKATTQKQCEATGNTKDLFVKPENVRSLINNLSGYWPNITHYIGILIIIMLHRTNHFIAGVINQERTKQDLLNWIRKLLCLRLLIVVTELKSKTRSQFLRRATRTKCLSRNQYIKNLIILNKELTTKRGRMLTYKTGNGKKSLREEKLTCKLQIMTVMWLATSLISI